MVSNIFLKKEKIEQTSNKNLVSYSQLMILTKVTRSDKISKKTTFFTYWTVFYTIIKGYETITNTRQFFIHILYKKSSIQELKTGKL